MPQAKKVRPKKTHKPNPQTDRSYVEILRSLQNYVENGDARFNDSKLYFLIITLCIAVLILAEKVALMEDYLGQIYPENHMSDDNNPPGQEMSDE